MMSTGGFLTPTRGQGKLPDARTPPQIMRTLPATPTQNSPARLPSLPPSSNHPVVTGGSSVISETVEERTEYYTEGFDDINSRLSREALPAEDTENISPGKKHQPPITPTKAAKKDMSKVKIKDKSKAKVRSAQSKSPKSPKSKKAKSPGSAKSPKGSSTLKSMLLTEDSKGSPTDIALPRLSPAPSPLLKSEPPEVHREVLMSGISDEESKLIIVEDEARRMELEEEQKRRMAAYDDTIDNVIKQAGVDKNEGMGFTDDEDEDNEEEKLRMAKISDTIDYVIGHDSPMNLMNHSPVVSKPPPSFMVNIKPDEDDEMVKKRQLEVQKELEKIREQQKVWEKQERERLEREAKIDDTIDFVVKAVMEGAETPGKEKDVYSFSDDEDDFHPPIPPSTPKSPEIKKKEKKDKSKLKKALKIKIPPDDEFGDVDNNQDVKSKLKQKLQKKSLGSPDWPKMSVEKTPDDSKNFGYPSPSKVMKSSPSSYTSANSQEQLTVPSLRIEIGKDQSRMTIKVVSIHSPKNNIIQHILKQVVTPGVDYS